MGNLRDMDTYYENDFLNVTTKIHVLLIVDFNWFKC